MALHSFFLLSTAANAKFPTIVAKNYPFNVRFPAFLLESFNDGRQIVHLLFAVIIHHCTNGNEILQAICKSKQEGAKYVDLAEIISGTLMDGCRGFGVYCFSPFQSGSGYIGMTYGTLIQRRWTQHLRKPVNRTKVEPAIDKHGAIDTWPISHALLLFPSQIHQEFIPAFWVYTAETVINCLVGAYDIRLNVNIVDRCNDTTMLPDDIVTEVFEEMLAYISEPNPNGTVRKFPAKASPTWEIYATVMFDGKVSANAIENIMRKKRYKGLTDNFPLQPSANHFLNNELPKRYNLDGHNKQIEGQRQATEAGCTSGTRDSAAFKKQSKRRREDEKVVKKKIKAGGSSLEAVNSTNRMSTVEEIIPATTLQAARRGNGFLSRSGTLGISRYSGATNH